MNLERLIYLRFATCVVKRYDDKASFDHLWQQKYQFAWHGLYEFLCRELKDIKIVGIKHDKENV